MAEGESHETGVDGPPTSKASRAGWGSQRSLSRSACFLAACYAMPTMTRGRAAPPRRRGRARKRRCAAPWRLAVVAHIMLARVLPAGRGHAGGRLAQPLRVAGLREASARTDGANIVGSRQNVAVRPSQACWNALISAADYTEAMWPVRHRGANGTRRPGAVPSYHPAASAVCW